MVLAQSLFKLLAMRYPGAAIDVLAPEWSKPLLTRMPEVREALPFPIGHGELKLGERIAWGRRLRDRAYDQAIVLTNSLKSAFIPWVAQIPQRTGFRGEWRYGLLNDRRDLDAGALPRTVDRFLALGLEPGESRPDLIPFPKLIVRRENAFAVLEKMRYPRPSAAILGLCPGAEFGAAKRWPVEYFAEVARAKLDSGWAVWLFGSTKDAAVTAEIQNLTDGRCVDFGGRTSLAEAIDLMSLTETVVSNDSGLMHVAAALGRNLVAIFGSSDPRHTPPMSPAARIMYLDIECSPCFKRECPYGHYRCLRDLRPAQILSAMVA
jgi:heptosyltransferase II